MSNTAHTFRKWEHWLKRIDEEQLQDLLINHFCFEQFRKVIKLHKASCHRAVLAAWITQGQLAFICIAIRRMTEKQQERKGHSKKGDQRRIVSLRKLLDDLANHADLLTRERFKRLYSNPVSSKFADRDFDRIAGKGVGSLCKAKIEEDIRDMERKVELLKRLTDKVIAHTEQNRSIIGMPPSYGQLHRLVLWLEKLYRKYHLLIKGLEYSPPPSEDYDLGEDFNLLFGRDNEGSGQTQASPAWEE